MSDTEKAKQAIYVINNQLTELAEIVELHARDREIDTTNERLGRWKSRTVKLLSENINYHEGEKFEKTQLRSVPDDPIERTKDLVTKYNAFLRALLEGINKYPEDYLSDVPPSNERVAIPKIPKSTSKKTVFIVHGRDEKLRESMFNFLRALGLSPLEWSQAIQKTKKSSPYIGEILDTAFVKAQAIIILFSGDDEARLRKDFLGPNEPIFEKELTHQPRPNVIFEAGMAFGRNENRTILVQIGEIRPISDIAGRHITHLDNTSQKRQELVTKLRSAGCEVDINGTDWLSVGDFKVIPQIPNIKNTGSNIIPVIHPRGQ